MKRRKRRSRYAEHNDRHNGAPATATSSGSVRGDSRSSSSGHHHRSHTRRTGARLLWIALLGGACIYAAFLGVSVMRGANRKAAAAANKPAVDPTLVAPAGVSTATAQRIEALIAEWNRVPDVMVEAQTFVDQGAPDQAIERLARALESAPGIVRLQLRLAQICAKEGRHAQAEDLLIRALGADPDHAPARLLLAQSYVAQTNHAAALATARWILQTEPNSVPALQIAANAYLDTDRRALAIPHLRKIVSLDRDNVAAQNQLAMAYTQLGEYVKAIQLFNELLSRNTRDSVTYYNLAVCYAKQGMVDQSVEVLARAIGMFGRDFVESWLQSKDFDSIRRDAMFVALATDEEKQEGKKRPAPDAPQTPAP